MSSTITPPAASAGTAVTVPYGTPNTYQQWAQDLVTYADELGGSLPNTPGELSLISAWEQAENPVSQIGTGYYNPLNTSVRSAGGVTLANGTEPGSSFIPTFPNVIAGLEATWATLNQGPADSPGNYSPELNALESDSPSGLVSALGTSGSIWGTSPTTVGEILGSGASTESNNEGGATSITGTASSVPASSAGSSSTSTAAPGATLASGLNANPLDGFGIPGILFGGVEGAVSSTAGPIVTAIENGGLVFLGIIFIVIALVLVGKAGMDSAGKAKAASAGHVDLVQRATKTGSYAPAPPKKPGMAKRAAGDVERGAEAGAVVAA